MKTICDLDHAHMIKPDGGLWHGSASMVVELEKKGWRQVVNPKRNYYFEYDLTHPSYVQRTTIQMDRDANILEVEIL